MIHSFLLYTPTNSPQNLLHPTEPMNQFANFIQEADSIFQRTSSISHDSHSEHKNLAALCLEVAENSSKYQRFFLLLLFLSFFFFSYFFFSSSRPALPQSFSTRKKKDGSLPHTSFFYSFFLSSLFLLFSLFLTHFLSSFF